MISTCKIAVGVIYCKSVNQEKTGIYNFADKNVTAYRVEEIQKACDVLLPGTSANASIHLSACV